MINSTHNKNKTNNKNLYIRDYLTVSRLDFYNFANRLFNYYDF